MLLYQQFFYFLIGLGILLGLPGLWMFSRAMWPSLVERGRDVASRRLLMSFLAGLPVVLLVVALLFNAGKVGQAGGIFVVALIGILLMWGFIGVSGLAAHVGMRLWPSFSGDDAWRAMLRGCFVIASLMTIPFIGWFILPLVLVTIGFGINVRSFFNRGAAA